MSVIPRALLVSFVPVSVICAQEACPRAFLPAYAHNDYENERPLADALGLGYRGVEVDVFLLDSVLRVDHDAKSARRRKPFESVYLAPLRALVGRCGHLTADHRPFLVAIELKERSEETFDSLSALLSRYSDLFAESFAPRLQRSQ
ncbi:MAG: hypothetical protein WD825_08000 [Gemmatimonadaceae bacterium]